MDSKDPISNAANSSTVDSSSLDSSTMDEREALSPIFIKLPTENIVMLKFLLESYEGLGILRTLDPQTGEVVILSLSSTAATVRELLTKLTDELKLRIVPAPEDLKGDWLLAEEQDFIRY